jgi:hypothetical protein
MRSTWRLGGLHSAEGRSAGATGTTESLSPPPPAHPQAAPRKATAVPYKTKWEPKSKTANMPNAGTPSLTRPLQHDMFPRPHHPPPTLPKQPHPSLPQHLPHLTLLTQRTQPRMDIAAIRPILPATIPTPHLVNHLPRKRRRPEPRPRQHFLPVPVHKPRHRRPSIRLRRAAPRPRPLLPTRKRRQPHLSDPTQPACGNGRSKTPRYTSFPLTPSTPTRNTGAT